MEINYLEIHSIQLLLMKIIVGEFQYSLSFINLDLKL